MSSCVWLKALSVSKSISNTKQLYNFCESFVFAATLFAVLKKYPASQNLEPAKIPCDTISENSAKQILLEW